VRVAREAEHRVNKTRGLHRKHQRELTPAALSDLSRPEDKLCFELHSRVKFDAVARRRSSAETCSPAWHRLLGHPGINNPKGTFMKCASVVKAAAAVVAVVGLAACQDIKPLQAEVADLKAQLAKVQGDVAAAKSSADQANSAAQSASQAASGAQSTANQAVAAAHASQSCCDATNEKIDRMFKRSVSK
jgi:murein lipoprotein